MQNHQKKQEQVRLFDTDVIDFMHYINIVKRYFWRITGCALILSILAGLFAVSLTSQYTSTVSILIESEQTNISSIEEVYGIDSSSKEYFATQTQIIQSRQIATRVVEQMKLHENEHFNLDVMLANKSVIFSVIDKAKGILRSAVPFVAQKKEIAQTPEQKLNSRKSYATSLLMESMITTPIKSTQVVEVSVESPDSALSAQIANTIAEVYIKSYVDTKLEMTGKATQWLSESLDELRNKLDTAEQNLAEFYEREQLVDIDGVVGLASGEVQQLSDQLISAQVNLKRNRAIFEHVNKEGVTLAELSTLPEVLNHPSIQEVKRDEAIAKSKVSELKEIYGPKHPVMMAAQAESNSISNSLRQQISNLVSGIVNEHRTIESTVDALKKDVEAAKRNFRKLSGLDNTRRVLQREGDASQQLYDTFFTRLKETNHLDGFESTKARVLDYARPAMNPSKPKKGLIVLGAFVLSFGFGMLIAIVLDAMDSSIRSVEDVERKLGQRMLGIIPWQAHKKKQGLALRHFFSTEQQKFSESVRTLRANLQLLNSDKDQSQTILITSSVPKEGKSTVAVNLAFAFGQVSKVLLVDADLRKPTIAKRFKLNDEQPGLVDVVEGTNTLIECIVSDQESNIDVLCAGAITQNSPNLLSSDKFGDVMQTLSIAYDYIIVDSGPTQAISDTIIMSKYCDSLVYVVKSDSTDEGVISSGLNRYIQVGHRVDGIVLNQVDLKKAKKSGQYEGYLDRYDYSIYANASKQKA
jgi:capsular exopolysaccharide synthesis family protein